MRASECRGGRWLAEQRAEALEEGVVVTAPGIVECGIRPPATAPLWQVATIRGEALVMLAAFCRVSAAEFSGRYEQG
jgi:hypothetical protein